VLKQTARRGKLDGPAGMYQCYYLPLNQQCPTRRRTSCSWEINVMLVQAEDVGGPRAAFDSIDDGRFLLGL
jgi:hypothetical protein